MKAWLQLFRVPNLFTVPGDPLAAFLIATRGVLDARVWPAIGASLCLYAAGLAMNDLADLEEDRRDRPKRPLPSGAVSKGAAWTAVVLLCVIALSLLAWRNMTAGIVGVVLLGHIALYNFRLKHVAVLGPITMGLCRALSAALGAIVGLSVDPVGLALGNVVAATQPFIGTIFIGFAGISGLQNFQVALASGTLVGIYIAAVTNLARHETKPTYPRLARMLPVGAMLLGYLGLKQHTGMIFLDQAPTLWIMALVLCAMNATQLMKEPPPPLPPRIGGFIRILPVMQAAICLVPTIPSRFHKTPDSFLCAVLLLACVPISAWLGKKFYAS
jgi:4-hydroxybenzoate polyprenyltransferase